MKTLIGCSVVLMGLISWAGPFHLTEVGSSRKIWDLRTVKQALQEPERYTSRVQDFFKKHGEKSKVYEFERTSSATGKTEMKSLFVHDGTSGDAVFQVEKADGSGFQGQLPLGKLEYKEYVNMQVKDVDGSLHVTAEAIKPRTNTPAHDVVTEFKSMPVNGKPMFVTTKQRVHIDYPAEDARIYTEKTISVLENSKRIRVSNLSFHRIPGSRTKQFQTNAIAEIPNPIPNSKVMSVQIDADNKVLVSILDGEGNLHNLNYKFIEESSQDLATARVSQVISNRARLAPDESRSTTVLANAVKNGHIKGQLEMIPAPQKVSTTQNINNIKLPSLTPAAVQ